MPQIKFAGPRVAQSIKDNTWQAINVSQGVADMCFGSCELIDETTGERYVFREGESYDPVNLPSGHKVSTSFLCSNCGEVALRVFAYIELIDPDGVARASASNPGGTIPQLINPGVGYYSKAIGPVTLDKAGLWLVYGRLEYDIA